MAKFINAKQAAALIEDGMTVAFGGFGAHAGPDELLQAIADRYAEENHPKGITAVCGISTGDFKTNVGLNRLKAEGLLDTIYAGHFANPPEIGRMIGENKIAGYAVPLGVVVHVMRAIAGHKPAVLTHVGLGTFADPRVEGCKANQKTIDQNRDIVEVVNFGGKDYLAYKTFPVNACVMRGTYADEDGNISLEEESCGDYSCEMAEAAHASGGIVIVQVKEIVSRGVLHPKNVKLHRSIVDYVVKTSDVEKYHKQNYGAIHRPELCGDVRCPVDAIPPMALDNRKVIARRSAMELVPDCLINLGIGIPSGIGSIANEEGFSDQVTLSLESGPQGGVPMEGPCFGASVNAECIYNCGDMFDQYDGGVLDMTFLGAAEIDNNGNVNVSRFGTRCTGPGGFVNISQNTKKVYFVGTFTAGGLVEEIGDGKLTIVHEGKNKKFVNKVQQITFSGDYARETEQEVAFITERAVLKLLPEGLTLTEIAPGIDLQRDVLDQMEFTPIVAKDLKIMDPRIFTDAKMGISL
jgi:propionate CoA-transferase